MAHIYHKVGNCPLQLNKNPHDLITLYH
jgi:hypothetical protein